MTEDTAERGPLHRAARAVAEGELVVYPTETVYGLGADALDPAAVERVFDVKGRDRDDPVSMAVPDVSTAAEYTRLAERERTFMEIFLPGPVTVVVEAQSVVPDVLTAGRERVGVRVPDHEQALALARSAGPVTATSSNVSGRPSARRIADLDEEIREAAAVVVEDEAESSGEANEPTAGTPDEEPGSTVVDVSASEIHRRGANAEAVEEWLAGR